MDKHRLRATADARADTPHMQACPTHSTSATGQGLRYELATTGLVLTLVDTHGSGLWRLSRTTDGMALLTVAGVGPKLLRCGYIIDRRGVETAVAVGHRQRGYLPEEVRFTTRGIRWRQELNVDPVLVAGDLWIAEAAGAFDFVSVEGQGSTQTTGLDGQFRYVC
jgi:hypothetical protein